MAQRTRRVGLGRTPAEAGRRRVLKPAGWELVPKKLGPQTPRRAVQIEDDKFVPPPLPAPALPQPVALFAVDDPGGLPRQRLRSDFLLGVNNVHCGEFERDPAHRPAFGGRASIFDSVAAIGARFVRQTGNDDLHTHASLPDGAPLPSALEEGMRRAVQPGIEAASCAVELALLVRLDGPAMLWLSTRPLAFTR